MQRLTWTWIRSCWNGLNKKPIDRRTTVAEIVARQLRVMARNWEESEAGRTPITDELRGVISMPAEFDEQEELSKEVSRKHAV